MLSLSNILRGRPNLNTNEYTSKYVPINGRFVKENAASKTNNNDQGSIVRGVLWSLFSPPSADPDQECSMDEHIRPHSSSFYSSSCLIGITTDKILLTT